MAVVLASLLSGPKEQNFYSDYELRLLCSLKVDINKLPISTKIKRSGQKKS